MSIAGNISEIRSKLPAGAILIAVTKTKPAEDIMEAYHAGLRDFGENRVQELVPKYEALPKDIRWHLIGHLQSNKVKYIAPFVHLIQSVDSEKLLEEINKQAARNNRIIHVLLQIFIAKEETKFGFSFEEARDVLKHQAKFPNVKICGVMGMATNTDNTEQVRNEFRSLARFRNEIASLLPPDSFLSMGMSSDWEMAITEGSNMIRVGSSIFGLR